MPIFSVKRDKQVTQTMNQCTLTKVFLYKSSHPPPEIYKPTEMPFERISKNLQLRNSIQQNSLLVFLFYLISCLWFTITVFILMLVCHIQLVMLYSLFCFCSTQSKLVRGVGLVTSFAIKVLFFNRIYTKYMSIFLCNSL